jgi:DNA-binding NtrC family response regulator
MLKILLIEDERINRVTLQQLLEHSGYFVHTEEDGLAGIEAINSTDFDVVISDLRLPGADGVEILKHVKSTKPHIHFLIMTAFATVENAVEALKNGAYDYLTKPFDPEELFHHLNSIQKIIGLNHENEALRASLAKVGVIPELIGESPGMLELLQKVQMVADSDHTVLIQGASGTGKELIAKAIQSMSGRRDAPYIKVNCSALSETLFETEMFGHEKGAFTGAIKRSLGRFERATGGTIFLDDIDDLSLGLQTKLLRVIQEGEIERVGGDKVIRVDVRLIAATKIDLKNCVAEGRFREDLYYRLNVIRLEIPPLNQRRDDIPLLARHFLNGANHEKQISVDLLSYLRELDWPGNVRELEHLMLQMSIFSQSNTLSLGDLPEAYRQQKSHATSTDDAQMALTDRMNRYEADLIQQAMQVHGDNQNRVAASLGIPRTTLRSKLLKHGLITPGNED